MKLIWQKGTNWRCEQTGYYLLSNSLDLEGAAAPVFFKEGNEIIKDNQFILGPIEAALPDPELELPKGWKVFCDNEYAHRYWMIRVVFEEAGIGRNGETLSVGVTLQTRAACVRAINAALKAQEGIVFSDEFDELRRRASRYDKLIEEFLNDDIASHVIERMHAAVREEMGDDDEDR